MEGIGVTPGLRFYPIEEELVSFYLRHKLDGTRPDIDKVIRLVDIYTIEPWDLPNYSGELCKGDREQWFFFTGRQEREAQGGRPNRTTPSGYWKTTGSPSYVFSSDNRVIGVKKTMVFYSGKAPTGCKTKWKMNEYRAIDYHPFDTTMTTSTSTSKLRHEFSLCRVYVVSGSCRAFDRRPLDHPTTPASYANHIIDNNNNNGDNWQVFINEGFFLDQILAEWEQQHHFS